MPKDSVSEYTFEYMLKLSASTIIHISNAAYRESETAYRTYSDREIEMAQALIAMGED